jgi:hypothetical protein
VLHADHVVLGDAWVGWGVPSVMTTQRSSSAYRA